LDCVLAFRGVQLSVFSYLRRTDLRLYNTPALFFIMFGGFLFCFLSVDASQCSDSLFFPTPFERRIVRLCFLLSPSLFHHGNVPSSLLVKCDQSGVIGLRQAPKASFFFSLSAVWKHFNHPHFHACLAGTSASPSRRRPDRALSRMREASRLLLIQASELLPLGHVVALSLQLNYLFCLSRQEILSTFSQTY